MAAARKKEKQQYLVSEIMDPGYDADEFVAFMQNKRDGGNCICDPGDDVDNWSFSSLKDAVQAFKSKHSPAGDNKEDYEGQAGDCSDEIAQQEGEFARLKNNEEMMRRQTMMLKLNVLFEKAKEEKQSIIVDCCKHLRTWMDRYLA